MPGLICSIHDPADASIRLKWEHGLKLVVDDTDQVVEQHHEPGIALACVYHPDLCKGPRMLVTEAHVLALYGNLCDEDFRAADGAALCRMLLDRFIRGGPAALQHLNGRYDIGIWDRAKRQFHLVGDRFGANRHYVLQRPGALHLACEVKALAPFLDRVEVDPAGLASMLSFGLHLGDLTLLKGVRCLNNARRLEYRADDDHLRVDSYWDYPYGEQAPLQGTEPELAASLYRHLTTALQRRLHGIDKILLPISGGLDSRTMAGLLFRGGYAGEVLAYSFGQPSSRDVRYGRAIARRLGYRHVTIPTPADFVTRHVEQAAWRFDAEWSAELNWGPRYSHRHPALGDTRGYAVLSGMFGDLILGEGAFVGAYRHKAGDAPQPVARLSEVFISCNQEYGPPDQTLSLFVPEQAAESRERILAIIRATLAPLENLAPYFALNRSEFLHRQRRHTATVAQSVEYDRDVITPFLDNDVVDFAGRVPYELLSGKHLYKHMIRDHLPEVAALPYAKTGLPLSPAPLREAWHWRMKKLVARLPALSRYLDRRDSNFRFQDRIVEQKSWFQERETRLEYLFPPLDRSRTLARYRGILENDVRPADQLGAFLPPALFLHELKRRLAQASNVPAPPI